MDAQVLNTIACSACRAYRANDDGQNKVANCSSPSEMSQDNEMSDITKTCYESLSASVMHKIHKACAILSQGGVIICPTEGVYGISCLSSMPKAIERVINIKHRALNKGLIVVASSLEQAAMVANFKDLSEPSRLLIKERWPGPHTFIVPSHEHVSAVLTGERSTVAVRVSAFPLLNQLCALVGEPIVSTSANLSGAEPIAKLQTLYEVFSDKVDYILDEPCQGLKKPSTIYDAIAGKVLRQ